MTCPLQTTPGSMRLSGGVSLTRFLDHNGWYVTVVFHFGIGNQGNLSSISHDVHATWGILIKLKSQAETCAFEVATDVVVSVPSTM